MLLCTRVSGADKLGREEWEEERKEVREVVKDTLPMELEVARAEGDSVEAVERVCCALKVPEKDPAAVLLLTKLLLGFPVLEREGSRECVKVKVRVWEAGGE